MIVPRSLLYLDDSILFSKVFGIEQRFSFMTLYGQRNSRILMRVSAPGMCLDKTKTTYQGVSPAESLRHQLSCNNVH